jgi:hypothetical protein
MHYVARVLALPLLLVILCTGSVSADSTPEARAWLEKLTEAYNSPYRVHYLAEMNVDQMGQAISMQMEGVTTQADREHMRMELKIVMAMGEMRTSIAMLGVLDGETLWLQSDNPLAGGVQVTSIPAGQAKELSGGAGLAGGASGIDPVGQIEQMANAFDFDVAEVADGEVTLVAKLTQESLAEISMMLPPDAVGLEQFALVLDEKTAFPRSMRIGGEVPFMVMRFDDPDFVDADKLAPETFQYAPPEGAKVIDMGATISVDE